MQKSTLRLVAASLVTVMSGPVLANGAIDAANNEVGLSVGGQNTSFQAGADSTIGTMPAFGVNVQRQGPLFGIQNVYTALAVNGSAGRQTYQTPAGFDRSCARFAPYSESDSAFAIDVSGKVGKGVPLGAAWQLTPYIEGGYHYWNRHVSWSPSGYAYQHGYVGLGLLTQYAPTSRLVVGLDLSAAETISPNVHVQGQSLSLQSRPILAATFSADYALTQRLHLTASYGVQRFRYGQSQLVDTVYSGLAFEPSSQTTTQSIMLGAAYAF
ncbi:hypothetical protein [Burkholderia pseudomallei]|uniref:hypothetical protein n=1 Tax=Burkholderia pseudomallei TaxID=28450 RepID=UPI0022EA911E|nr:hypothetical protein [Burkholderia pseudomallei]